MPRLSSWVLLLWITSMAGCSGSSTGTPGGAVAVRAFARTSDKPPYPREKGTASIKGQITLKGQAPVMEKIDLKTDPVCAAMHQEKGLYNQSILVGDHSEIQNVLVYISKGLEAYSFEVPEKPFELSQKECQFVPRVFGMLNGQVLKANNLDATFHNVRSKSALNPFNLLSAQGSFDSCVIAKPEGPVTFVCDVHHWMRAHCVVLTHPFFDVTGPFGKFELKGLLPGEYTLTIWHEALGTQSLTIKIGDKEEKIQDFTLEVSAK